MAERGNVLRNHKLVHLGEIGIEENFLRSRFAKACSTSQCKGDCCKTGVWVDLGERDLILANAELIRSHMEAGQEHNPDLWFDADIVEDSDFPSGRAEGTQVFHHACVFLSSAGRCVLQIASQDQAVSLKPFYCFAYPITLEQGTLTLDDGFDSICCTPVPDGELDVFDVCAGELRFVLGDEGLSELEQLAQIGPKAAC